MSRRHTAHAIIPHAAERRILAIENDGRLRLPFAVVPDMWLNVAAVLNRAMFDAFGITVTTLRSGGILRFNQRRIDTVYVMDNDDAAWQAPAGAVWMTIDRIGDIASSGERGAAQRWFAEAESAALSSRRMSWERRGWHREAEAWAGHALTRVGRNVTGKPEQVKHWCLSSIIRIPAEPGDVWLKTVPPIFAHEGALINVLAARFRGNVPRILQADHQNGRLLMEPIAGESLRDVEAAPHADAMRLLAEIQVAFADEVHDLLAAGCADRRLATLEGALAGLLASDSIESLTRDERELLIEFGQELPARIDALQACGVPETLLHGDFHPGNIAWDGIHLVIYDWTDGCVGHPFFDLATYLPPNIDAREALLAAYLDPWRQVCDEGSLRKGLHLAVPLAVLHHAVSYRQICDSVDPSARWEMGGAEEGWLRRLVAVLKTELRGGE